MGRAQICAEAGDDSGGVGDVAWPDSIRDHKSKDSGDVVLGTFVPGLSLDVLEPRLEVILRVSGEGMGVGVVELNSDIVVGGWMDGWMDE